MAFHGDASLKRVRQIRGYGAFVVAVVLVATLYLSPVDRSVDAIGFAVILLIVAFGALQLYLAARTPDTMVVRAPINPNELPVAERARYFRRYLIMSAIVFPAMSIWIAYDLNQLEAGAVAEVYLWSPIAFLYENFGYWPALLATPTLGLVLICVGLVRLTNPPDP